MVLSIQEQFVNEPVTNAYGHYNQHHKMEISCVFKNKHVSIYTFAINCKAWETVSTTQRYAELVIPTLTDEIYEKGLVIVFLDEYNKKVALPFVYYQLRNSVTIKATYSAEKIYINIHGKFVPSVNSSFYFRAIVVDEALLNNHKDMDWTRYTKIIKGLKVKEKPANTLTSKK